MTETSIPVQVRYDSSQRPHPFLDELIQLFRYRSLVTELAARDIKVRIGLEHGA